MRQSLCGSILILLTATAGFGQEAAQFTTQSNLVVVPFNVIRDKLFITDLQQSDVTLLEDKKPREFTIFEGPSTSQHVPVELTLLFDTTTTPPRQPGVSRPVNHWDRASTYRALIDGWDDKAGEEVLHMGRAEIRVSVYRYDFDRLQRLCESTSDPRELREALGRLLTPMPESDSTRLVTLKKETEAARRNMGWSFPYPASLAVLNDIVKERHGTLRMLVMFSEGFAGGQGEVQELVDKSNDAGIQLYPVLLDYDKYFQRPAGAAVNGISGGAPIRGPEDGPGEANSFNASTPLMDRFASVGALTGGRYFSPSRLDPGIVEAVRNEGFSQYVVGFTPESSGAAVRTHKLEVRLKTKDKGKMINGQRNAAY